MAKIDTDLDLPATVYILEYRGLIRDVCDSLATAKSASGRKDWRACAYTDDGEEMYYVHDDAADYWETPDGLFEIRPHNVSTGETV